MNIPDPTHDQCSNNERIQLEDGRWATAAWYPSMGGYVSHCLIVKEPDSSCIEVFVWHDGQFPFGGDIDERWPGEPVRSPSRLHHCNAASFIGFGKLAQRVQDGEA